MNECLPTKLPFAIHTTRPNPDDDRRVARIFFWGGVGGGGGGAYLKNRDQIMNVLNDTL